MIIISLLIIIPNLNAEILGLIKGLARFDTVSRTVRRFYDNSTFWDLSNRAGLASGRLPVQLCDAFYV